LQAFVLNQIGNSGRAFCAGNPTAGLNLDGDGGPTPQIQNDVPGKGKEGNGLPAPKGGFRVILRTYMAGTGIVQQTAEPPARKRVD
jgi:hypothetical protein